ncbi:MAG: hypothetical protein ACFFA0_12070 [Promethearchaeota archaeon]
MYVIFFIILEIGYFLISCIAVFTLIHIIRYHENYGIKLMALLNFLTIFNITIIYSSLYLSSITIFFSESLNIILWKLSIFSGLVSLLLNTIIYTFLRHYKELPDFPFLYFITLFGMLIGILFLSNSIDIRINISKPAPFFIHDLSQINYYYEIITGLLITIFQCSNLIYYFTLSFLIHKKARSRKTTKSLIRNTLFLPFPILMYILYIFLKLPIFRELHIIFQWITIYGFCVILLKRPEMFMELTNKIYYINIYHKSGILLYSYKFTKSPDELDSAVWGNILIGINHILSEFVDKRNQIDVLQTKNTDIIVNYDDFGFAVVLITNRKNAILQRLMENFTFEFRNKYKDELLEIQDLNRLINVSEFKQTGELIEKGFQLYI